MELKVAKFEMSPSFTASVLPHNGVPERTYKASRPISTLIRKRLSQLEALPSQQQKNRLNEELDQFNTAVNLCPDGSEISISANGTTLTATKTSLNVTIGKFTICIKSCDDHTLIKEDNPIPSAVALVSIAKGTPLHVILEDGVLHVTAARSFTEVLSNPNAQLINSSTNGQGEHYLTANHNNNTYHVAIDPRNDDNSSDNNIQTLHASETADTSSHIFKREFVPSVVDQARYYVESTDGNKYYLMVTSEGDVTSLNANDLEIGSSNDFHCRFRHITE